MGALSFLRDITGYVQAQATPTSASKPIKLATIDPAYAAASYASGTLPKVTFDGESTMSGKLYPVLGTYWPNPGDRVALAPVGTTYLILGPIASDGVSPAPHLVTVETDQETNSTNFQAGSTQCSTTFTAPASGSVYVTVSGTVECQSPSYAVLSWEVREDDASGTVVTAADDRRALVVQDANFVQASYRRPLTGLTAGDTYFIRTMLRTSNASQKASAFWRELCIEPARL